MRRIAPCSFAIAVVALAPACSPVEAPALLDAQVTDAGPTIDATVPPGEVTLHVHEPFSGVPRAGATAVFTRPDGSLRGTATSGEDGVITFVVEVGDTAHVGWRTGNEDPATGPVSYQQYLVTIVALEPGDDIDVYFPLTEAPTSILAGNVIVTPPTGTLPAAATSFRLYLGCFGFNDFPQLAPLTLPVDKLCLDAQSELTLLATAVDANGALVAQAVVADLTFQADLLVTMPEWQLAAAPVTLTFVPPADSNSLTAQLAVRRDGRIFEQTSASAAPTDAGLEHELPLPFSPGYADSYELTIRGTQPANPDNGQTYFLFVRRGPATDLVPGWTIDNAETLPRVAQAGYSFGALRWKLTGTPAQQMNLAKADCIAMQATWSGPGYSATWDIIAPPTTASPLAFVLYDLIGYQPPPATVVGGYLDIYDVTSEAGGYRGFKNDVGTFPFNVFAIDGVPDLRALEAVTFQRMSVDFQ